MDKDILEPQEVHITACVMVRNQAHQLEDLLANLIKHFDSLVLCDLESSDGSSKKIKSVLETFSFKNYTVFNEKWRDCASNAEACLMRVPENSTHVLFLHANERFMPNARWSKEYLADKSACVIRIFNQYQDSPKRWTVWYQIRLFKNDRRVRFTSKLDFDIELPEDSGTPQFSESLISNACSICSKTDKAYEHDRTLRFIEVGLNTEELFSEKGDRESFVAEQFVKLKRYNSAYSWYLKAVDLYSDKSEKRWFAKYMSAKCLIKLGHTETAQEVLRQCIELRPQRAEPLKTLAHLLLDLAKVDEAFKILDEIKKMPYPRGDKFGVEPNLYKKIKSDNTHPIFQ